MKFFYRAMRKSFVVRGPSVLLALTFIAALTGCAGQPAPDSGAAGAGRGGGRGDAAIPVTVAAVVEKTVPLEVTTVGSGEPDTTVKSARRSMAS